MPRYMTIYRFKAENFKHAFDKFMTLMDGRAPKEVLEANKKLTVENMEMVGGWNFFMAIWEIKEEDMWAAQVVAMYLDDSFAMETYPIVPMELHNKALDIFKKTLVAKK